MFTSLILGLSSAGLGANGPGVADSRATGVSWVSLSYEAGVSMASTEASITIERIQTVDAITDLISPGTRTGLEPDQDSLLTLSVHTVVKGGFFSTKRYRGRVLFEPGDGRSLQRSRLREGSDGNLRIYRYTDGGVFRLRLEPRDRQEARLPAREWSSRSESYFAFNGEAQGCASIVDPAALLYLVTRPDWLSDATARSVCVFNKRALYRVKITHLGAESLNVAYQVDAGEGEREVKGERRTLKLQFDPEPLGEGAEDVEPFEFLGLEGVIQLFIDDELGVPVRVSGYTPRVGEGALDLTRAVLVGPTIGD